MSEREFKGVWIPKEIWLAKDLGWTEKMLFVEIDSLCKNKECFATNEYFANFFNLKKDTISKIISSLKTKGYIDVKLEYKEGTKQVLRRIISTIPYLKKILGGIGEKSDTPIGEKSYYNNTDNNNTINNSNNNKENDTPIGESDEEKREKYYKEQRQRQTYYDVINLLGLGHNDPTPDRLEITNKWVNEYNMPLDVIELVKHKSIENINIVKIPYIDKILTDFFNLGINTVELAKKHFEDYRKTKTKENNTYKKPNKDRTVNRDNISYDVKSYESWTDSDDYLDKVISSGTLNQKEKDPYERLNFFA